MKPLADDKLQLDSTAFTTQLFVKPSKNSKIVSKYEADTMDDECYCSQRANSKAQWTLPTGPDGGGNGD